MKFTLLVLLSVINLKLIAQTPDYIEIKKEFDNVYREYSRERSYREEDYYKSVEELDKLLYTLLKDSHCQNLDFKKYSEISDHLLIDSATSGITNFRLVKFHEQTSNAKGWCDFHSFIHWKIKGSCYVFRLTRFQNGQVHEMYKLNDSLFLSLGFGGGNALPSVIVLKFKSNNFSLEKNMFPNFFFDKMEKDCKNLTISPSSLMCFECEIKFNPKNKTISFDGPFNCTAEEKYGISDLNFTFKNDKFVLTKRKR